MKLYLQTVSGEEIAGVIDYLYFRRNEMSIEINNEIASIPLDRIEVFALTDTNKKEDK